jgi:hypothetical protein
MPSRPRPIHLDISHFSGEVVDTDHLEEVSGLAVSGSGSTWTDVHREIWIRARDGAERRFAFTNAAVPARKGHRVTVLVGAGRPLALINFSAELYVNLVSPGQFELFGAAEAFAFAGVLIAAGFAGSVGLVALLVATVTYALVKWLLRQQRYAQASSVVEAEIRGMVAYPAGLPAADARRPGAS